MSYRFTDLGFPGYALAATVDKGRAATFEQVQNTE
jgi:hypothetical protein